MSLRPDGAMAGGRSFYKVEEAIGPGVGDFVFAVMLRFVERVGKLDDFEVAFVQQEVDGRDCEILGTS